MKSLEDAGYKVYILWEKDLNKFGIENCFKVAIADWRKKKEKCIQKNNI